MLRALAQGPPVSMLWDSAEETTSLDIEVIIFKLIQIAKHNKENN